MNNDITVILSVYKRLYNLEAQFNAILKQTIKPKYIYIFQDGIDGEEIVEIPSCIKEKVDVLRKSNINVGVWGRFKFAQEVSTKYVCIFDDDTIPGKKWLENCLECMDKQEGLFGTNGVVLSGFNKYPFSGFYNIGWQNPMDCIQEVDFVGHSWFLKTEWIKLLFKNTEELQKFKTAGEDMTLSAKLLENNIHTFVPPHPDNDKEQWGSLPDKASKIGADINALSGTNQNRNKYQQCLQILLNNNFISLYFRTNEETKKRIYQNATFQFYIRILTCFLPNNKYKYIIRKILYKLLIRKCL